MELSETAQRFVLHWGEMGSRWGVNRSVAQIHALLFLVGEPLNAEEISETLTIARSNVSSSLKELQSWQLVRVVHVLGDRRDHFETSGDVWELFRTIVQGRKQREIDPTVQLLRELKTSSRMADEDPKVAKRIAQTLDFLEVLTRWSDQMLRLPPETLARVLKLGAGIQKLLSKGSGESKG